MRWSVLILGASLGLPSLLPLAGQDRKLPYEERYKDNLLYLHALVGYEFDLWDDFHWERRRAAGNGLRLNYGSVSTRELLTDAEIRINQPLGGGWLFLGQYRDHAGLHIQLRQQVFWAGFERYLWSGLSAFFRVNPLFDKELMDGELGLSLADAAREHYLRLAFRVEDINYDIKNDLGGISQQTPIGVRWLLRAGRQGIWVTSDGIWGRGFSRSYEDASKSPELRAMEQVENQGRLRLYFHPSARWLLELAAHHYRFSEEKSFHEGEGNDYRYRNRFSVFGARGALNPGEGHGFRISVQRVWQDSDAAGSREFDYRRSEWLPAIFYEYTRGQHGLVLGYMGSIFAWDFEDFQGVERFDTEDMTEKVKLGYTYRFEEAGSIHLSVSHVFSYLGFGGGSVQLNLRL
jgi:hypothetical protein